MKNLFLCQDLVLYARRHGKVMLVKEQTPVPDEQMFELIDDPSKRNYFYISPKTNPDRRIYVHPFYVSLMQLAPFTCLMQGHVKLDKVGTSFEINKEIGDAAFGRNIGGLMMSNGKFLTAKRESRYRYLVEGVKAGDTSNTGAQLWEYKIL